jgi:hypothetical protein
LADLIQVAEDCCADHGQLSKVAALQNLQTVLRTNPELSRKLQRRLAAELRVWWARQELTCNPDKPGVQTTRG